MNQHEAKKIIEFLGQVRPQRDVQHVLNVKRDHPELFKIIKAFSEGTQVQFNTGYGWENGTRLAFDPMYNYRIKPDEPVICTHHLYLAVYPDGGTILFHDKQTAERETDASAKLIDCTTTFEVKNET